MKTMISFLMLLIFSFAIADSNINEIPSYICDEVKCSKYQKEILASFLDSSNFEVNTPNVFSGKCYHLSNEYDGTFAHYGVAYIAKKADNFFWGSEFAFFYDKNPYASMKVSDAVTKFGDITGNDYNQFEVADNALFKNYGNDQSFTRYWIRTNKLKSKLYLISMWGINHRVFCELKKN